VCQTNTHPTSAPTNLTRTMPPRKKAAPTDTNPNADFPGTGAVRSSARLASQVKAVAVNPDLTTNRAVAKPPSHLKVKATLAKSKPASKSTQSTSKPRSKRTKAGTDDNEDDAPVSKKLKTTTIDEEEEDAMNMDIRVDNDNKDDKKDDKKMVTPTFYL
jgi:hypothetical protein